MRHYSEKAIFQYHDFPDSGLSMQERWQHKNWIMIKYFSHTVHENCFRPLALWKVSMEASYLGFLVTFNRTSIQLIHEDLVMPSADCIFPCIIHRETILMQAMNSLGFDIVFSQIFIDICSKWFAPRLIHRRSLSHSYYYSSSENNLNERDRVIEAGALKINEGFGPANETLSTYTPQNCLLLWQSVFRRSLFFSNQQKTKYKTILTRRCNGNFVTSSHNFAAQHPNFQQRKSYTNVILLI